MAIKGFMGRYEHTLDAKGRLFIPAKFRAGLGETFIICPSFHQNCLWAFSEETFNEIIDKLAGVSLMDEDSTMIESFLFQNANDVTLDSQGRVNISTEHRQCASLQKDVVIAGTRNRVEIWDKELYLARKPVMDERFRAAMERASAKGVVI